VGAIEARFQELNLFYATDLEGRMIHADELLLEVELLENKSEGARVAQKLYSLLQNYANPMPSTQRLFLIDWLRAKEINPEYRKFATYAAERGAERVLSEGKAAPGSAGLESSGLAGIWKLTSPSRRVIGLYSTEAVMRWTQQALGSPGNRGGAFTLTAPGQTTETGYTWAEAGAQLRGWRIGIPIHPADDPGTRRRIATYSWIAFLAIATVAVLSLWGGQILRRQMQVAHLKTDLVAAVSHELKTPLTSMKLLVESLLSGGDLEPKRTREYLQLVARENSRLSRLIDNFLTFSRMERNRGRFEFARVEPDAVAKAALESVGERFHVEFDLARGMPPLWADEDALVTVLLNLLDNAYKYTSENRRIRLALKSTGGRVEFSVSDNGIGISERDQKRVFRRFYQVDRQLSRKTGGVGLGLSIVEFIVKAHRGTVSVKSRPGQGSTFTVSLPASAAAREAA
jgi:signal transduction histidine kinase